MTQKDILLILEQERNRLNMSMEKYCVYLNFPICTYRKWVYNNRNPSVNALNKVLDAAGYEIAIRRKSDDAARDG